MMDNPLWHTMLLQLVQLQYLNLESCPVGSSQDHTIVNNKICPILQLDFNFGLGSQNSKLRDGERHNNACQTTPPGTLCPATLFVQCMGSFMSHRIVNNEELRDGTYGLSSLSEKTKESSYLQM